MARAKARDWLNNDYSGQRRDARVLPNDKLLIPTQEEHIALVKKVEDQNVALEAFSVGDLGFSPHKAGLVTSRKA